MIDCLVFLNLKFKYIKKLKEATHVHSVHPSVLPGFTQMPQHRHNLQAFIWSLETPNYGYLDFLLSPHWWVMQTGRVLFSGPCTRPGMFPSAISAHEHIAEQRLDVLVKFLRNLLHDSVHSLWAPCCHFEHSADVFGSCAAFDSQRWGIFHSCCSAQC